jgi:hypothetical protein
MHELFPATQYSNPSAYAEFNPDQANASPDATQ